MNNKQLITKKLNTLKKVGWEVYTFNSHSAMPSGLKGMPDHVLFFPRLGITVWAEVKIGADRLVTPQQIRFKTFITGEKFFNNGTYYKVVSERTIDDAVYQLGKY